MKSKMVGLILAMFLFTGCSLIPRVTFDKPNTLPQKTEKSQKRERCSGEAKYDPSGNILSCSKGYSLNENFYNKEERKTTLKERLINYMNGLIGWSFWIVIALLIFAPGLLSFILGKFIEGTIGVTGRALKATVRGIKNAKRNGGKYTDELQKEHDKDKGVKKKINQVRAEVE